MTDMCSYGFSRDETLIAYLYDDIDPQARAAFDGHLATCALCRDELTSLQGVRQQLARWAPPSPSVVVNSQQSTADRRRATTDTPGESHLSTVDRERPTSNRWWREIPAWAQVAAALLFLGVSARIANLDVRYDQNGLTVRTGWSTPVPASAAGAATRAGATGVTSHLASREDLAALERQLRAELRGAQTAARIAVAADAPARSASGGSDADVLRRVRALLDETEKRQQRELALRIGEVLRDVNAQRQADLVRIDRTLGVVENNLGVEVLKQRQSLNYLMRVNQRP
jgi:hypothetical protein